MHSKRIGYRKSTFYCLYLWGIFIILYGSFFTFFLHNIQTINIHGTSYGCMWYRDEIGKGAMYLGLLFYWGWDITILMMYFYKIRQFTRSANDINPVIYKRVSYIMNKILWLTICYECMALGSAFVTIAVRPFGIYGYIIRVTGNAISLVCNAFIAFLMIERNDELFNKLLAKLCCCCCSDELFSVGKVDEKNPQSTHKTNADSESTEYDTTSATVEMTINPRDSVLVSECTKTVADI